ncbi:MAG TPA: hypothetical protein VLM79_11145 [Kofleriaceae bacterium]|nr:hypothetical protein [Kofleriaceae bacterium]
MTGTPASYALVRVVHLTRPPDAAAPFWLPHVCELVIEVYATAPPSQLYVYGADPGATPPPPKPIVFSVALPDAQLTALLECVDGTRAFAAIPKGQNPDGTTLTQVDIDANTNVVVIGGDGPAGTGPNMGIVLATAVAVASNVALTNAALRREPGKSD